MSVSLCVHIISISLPESYSFVECLIKPEGWDKAAWGSPEASEVKLGTIQMCFSYVKLLKGLTQQICSCDNFFRNIL